MQSEQELVKAATHSRASHSHRIVWWFEQVSYVWQEALIAHGVLAFLFLLALAVPSANATPNKSNSAKSK